MSTSQSQAEESPVILVVGDSLSAAHGIDQNDGWVPLLQQRLRQQGYPYRVVNASISGDTTAGGLARLPAALRQSRPGIMILELGANDGLRGLSLSRAHDNLALMIDLARQAGARVLLLGMLIPPNLGPAYTEKFQVMYQQLAKQKQLPLVPFFLDGVADDRELMQDDGLHPNELAQARMLDNVWSKLRPLLADQ